MIGSDDAPHTARSSLAEADNRIKGRMAVRHPMASSWPSGWEQLSFCLERVSANFRTLKKEIKKVDQHGKAEPDCANRGRLFHLSGGGRSWVLPVSKEGAVEGFSIGVVVCPGSCQKTDIVWQHGSPGVWVGEVGEAAGDESLSRS